MFADRKKVNGRKDYNMGNLSREALAHYLDYSFEQTVASATWEILGDDIDDMSVDLNPDTETKKNILGQTKTTDNGYEPSMDADTYYANPDKKLYPKIRDIAMKRLKGADCKTLMLEVLVEDTSAENHLAYVEEVMVKPQSYGGDTSGVNIPFKVSSDGKRTEGYVSATSLASGNPEFTAGVIPHSLSTGKEVL